MTAALEVRGVTKRFGELTAVDQASFRVEPGQICGFIGPNGAGKTTTMRICSTLELPDDGDVFVDGCSVLEEPRAARGRLGFMPDYYGAYPNTTVAEYLDFFARAYRLPAGRRASVIDEVSEFTGLTPLVQKEMRGLSKGMKQRLCLAKTLLHDPPLLILDEPAAGLDPRARVELRELLKALADLDKAILISSHILTELSELCSSVVVIEQGRIRGEGSVRDVTRNLGPAAQLWIRTLTGGDETERALLEEPGVKNVRRERDGFLVELEGGAEHRARLLERLVQRGLRPIEFAGRETDLEDVFLSLTEGRVQ